MNKKEILDILDNAKDERGAVPMRLVRQALDKLPTIQPVATDTNVGDIISRQAAIDAIRAMQNRLFAGDDLILVDKAWVMTELMMLPSAQPERQTGVWLDDKDNPESVKTDGYCAYCSACKEWSEYLTAYCGSCGADMRGKE